MNNEKKILIVDDHKLFADGLAMILGNCDQQFVVQTSDDPQGLLDNIQQLTNYDLVLIDLYMPTLSGFVFLHAVKSQGLPIIMGVISGASKKAEIERAISLGTQGFIPKESSSEEFVDAAKLLLDGQRYLPIEWLGVIDWKTPSAEMVDNVDELTPRQQEVLELMGDGLQNKQIAATLGVSISAVKGHVEHLFKKTQVNNRTACVCIAKEKNWL